MRVGTLPIAVTGIQSAHRRVEVSSHNLANLQTEDFRPLKAIQSSRAEGGSVTEVQQAKEPEPVSVANEFVGSELAVVQAKASANMVRVEREILGSLLDIFT